MGSKRTFAPAAFAAILVLPLAVVPPALANDPPARANVPAQSSAEPPADDRAAFAVAMRKSSELVKAGRYGDAATWSAAAAGMALELHGPDSIETAVALHNDGFVLRS